MAVGPATYSGNPSASEKDLIRFLLGDTDLSTPADALFSDAEIEWGIGFWGPLYGSSLLTAAQLAETAAAQYAEQSSYSADGVSMSLGAVGDQLRALAASLRRQYAMTAQAGVVIEAGGMSEGEGQVPGTKPFAFGLGMDDDPEAGRQDWGGESPRDWPTYEYPGSTP